LDVRWLIAHGSGRYRLFVQFCVPRCICCRLRYGGRLRLIAITHVPRFVPVDYSLYTPFTTFWIYHALFPVGLLPHTLYHHIAGFTLTGFALVGLPHPVPHTLPGSCAIYGLCLDYGYLYPLWIPVTLLVGFTDAFIIYVPFTTTACR